MWFILASYKWPGKDLITKGIENDKIIRKWLIGQNNVIKRVSSLHFHWDPKKWGACEDGKNNFGCLHCTITGSLLCQRDNDSLSYSFFNHNSPGGVQLVETYLKYLKIIERQSGLKITNLNK